MRKLINKLFFSFVFIVSIVLTAASASALVITYADWNADSVTSTTITNGNSTIFRVAVESMDPPVSYSIRLHDSAENIIHTYADTTDGDGSYQAALTLNSSDYNNTAGSYTIRILASDADDVSSSSIGLTVVADTVAPGITINDPSNTTYNVSLVPLNLTVTDNGSISQVWYNLNNGTNTTIASPYNATLNLTDGAYTLYVFANDTSGNLNNTEFVNFNVNTTPPAPANLTINTISPSNNYQLNNTQAQAFTFNITSNTGTGNCSIYFDNTLNQTNASVLNNTNTAFTLNNITYGAHTWYLSCFNTNNTLNSTLRNFTVADTNGPTILNVTANPSSVNRSQIINISANITDIHNVSSAGMWITCGANQTLTNLGGNIWGTSYNTSNCSGSSGGTVINYYIYANDTFGNINQSSMKQFLVYEDSTAPVISFINPTGINYNYTNILINISVSDPNLDKVWYFNGTENVTLSSPYNITQIFADNNTYTLYAWANDTSGNIGNDTVTFSVNTTAPAGDTFAPSLSIISPTAQNYTGSLIPLNISASDGVGLSQVWYSLNNGANTTLASPYFTTLNLTDGSYTLDVWANDTSNNRNTTSVLFSINTTGSFAGSVRDDSNNLIANSNVSVLSTNYFNFTTTGNYVINGVPPGVYSLIATANSYLNKTITNQQITNATTTTVNFNLDPAGNLVGNVYNFTSKIGVANANLTLIQSGAAITTTMANGTGYYTFLNLAPGYYDVNVSASGYTDNSKPNNQVLGGQNTTVNFWIW